MLSLGLVAVPARESQGLWLSSTRAGRSLIVGECPVLSEAADRAEKKDNQRQVRHCRKRLRSQIDECRIDISRKPLGVSCDQITREDTLK